MAGVMLDQWGVNSCKQVLCVCWREWTKNLQQLQPIISQDTILLDEGRPVLLLFVSSRIDEQIPFMVSVIYANSFLSVHVFLTLSVKFYQPRFSVWKSGAQLSEFLTLLVLEVTSVLCKSENLCVVNDFLLDQCVGKWKFVYYINLKVRRWERTLITKAVIWETM